MDPTVSHILTNNVDYVEINEGPFNVEDFGALSGDVKIHTIKPKEEFEGEVNLGLGSLGIQKRRFFSKWRYNRKCKSLTHGHSRKK